MSACVRSKPVLEWKNVHVQPSLSRANNMHVCACLPAHTLLDSCSRSLITWYDLLNFRMHQRVDSLVHYSVAVAAVAVVTIHCFEIDWQQFSLVPNRFQRNSGVDVMFMILFDLYDS